MNDKKILAKIEQILNSVLTDAEKVRYVAEIVIERFKYDVRPCYVGR
jgi:hypothetical protein